MKSCSCRQPVKAPQKSGLRAEQGMYSRSGLHLSHPSHMSCWIDHTAGKLVWLFQIMAAASRRLSNHSPGQDSRSHHVAVPSSDGRGIYSSTISDTGYDPSAVGPPHTPARRARRSLSPVLLVGLKLLLCGSRQGHTKDPVYLVANISCGSEALPNTYF